MTIQEKRILQHILLLSKKLISIPSTMNNLEDLQKVITLVKNELQGYFPIQEFKRENIPSLLIHNTERKMKHFKIIMNAHLDVVPANITQFSPIEKDGKLVGRGSFDMKATAAVMIFVFKEIAKSLKYPLALQLVTDEDSSYKPGKNGTKYHIEQGVKGDFVITGEVSNFSIVHKSKGLIWLKITAKGIAAHAAYPWLGDNAIMKMQKTLQIIDTLYKIPFKDYWQTTVNVSRIETQNVAYNKVPAECSAYLDIRHIPSEKKEEIVENIRKHVPSNIFVEITNTEPAYETDPNHPYIQILKNEFKKIMHKDVAVRSTSGASDIRFYSEINCPCIEFSPKGGNHHGDNEWVDLKSLEEYYYILKNFLLAVPI